MEKYEPTHIRDDFPTTVGRHEAVCSCVLKYVSSMQSSLSDVQHADKLIKRHVSGTRLVPILRPKHGQDEGCTNPGRQNTLFNKSRRNAPDTRGLSVRNSLYITLPGPLEF